MDKRTNTERDWFTVFRTDEGNEWLRDELATGRLRQGWGAAGLGLVAAEGDPVDKAEWETAYRDRTDWGAPSPRRFAILRRMLELDRGDIVVMAKMPRVGPVFHDCARWAATASSWRKGRRTSGT